MLLPIGSVHALNCALPPNLVFDVEQIWRVCQTGLSNSKQQDKSEEQLALLNSAYPKVAINAGRLD